MSPGLTRLSQGDRPDTTRVSAIREMWRPIRLKVRVGLSSDNGRICPYGSRPSLISAWNPLQMPSTSPSRSLSSCMTASDRLGLWNRAAMNLPEPSGSSPALNPPGNINIWQRRIALASASTDCSMSRADRLRTTSTSGSPPAWAKARAESYSQLLPGNTGMMTRGFATDVLARPTAAGPGYGLKTAVSAACPVWVGNTFSSVSSQACCAAARETVAPKTAISGFAWVWPNKTYSIPASAVAGFSPAASSSTSEP